MIRLQSKPTIAAAILVLSCLSTARAQNQSNSSDTDTAAIKRSVSNWADAYNIHDPHGSAAGFTEDADMVTVAGINWHGRKAIEDHYTKTYSTSLKNAHITDTVKSIRLLKPEVADVEVDWIITGSLSKVPGDTSEVPTRKGILSLIFIKDKGQWAIAVSHEIEFNAPPKKS